MGHDNTAIIRAAAPTSSRTLNKFLSQARMGAYKLPGNPATDKYAIGVSGGADSAVVAMLMVLLFPEIDWVLVFTDTQAEADDTVEALDRLEGFVGRKITRIADSEGLFGLIKRFGGYLPSGQSRYCTRILKQETYERFMDEVRGDDESCTIHSFVGLRADEPGRSGIDSSMPWLLSHFPMRELGMERADVFNILSETVGIPGFYRYKSRSGCFICPFFRTSESLGLLKHNPEGAAVAESHERLTARDAARFAILGQDWSGQHVSAPIPNEIDLRDIDTFAPSNAERADTVTVYVGVEFFVDELMPMFGGSRAGTPGTWWHDLVGWSTSRGGLTRKLNEHFHMRHDTAEVWGLTEEAFTKQYRQAVMVVELPEHMVDLKPASSTEKDLNGRLCDEHGNALMVDGDALYMLRQKASEADTAAFALVTAKGTPVEANLTDAVAQPVSIASCQTTKFVGDMGGLFADDSTEDLGLQGVVSATGRPVFLDGVQVFREKKGAIFQEGSFAWRQGEPLAQIRQIANALKRTLHVEAMRQEAKELELFAGTNTWEGERHQGLSGALSAVDFDHGWIAHMERHTPSEKRPQARNAAEVPCFACSK